VATATSVIALQRHALGRRALGKARKSHRAVRPRRRLTDEKLESERARTSVQARSVAQRPCTRPRRLRSVAQRHLDQAGAIFGRVVAALYSAETPSPEFREGDRREVRGEDRRCVRKVADDFASEVIEPPQLVPMSKEAGGNRIANSLSRETRWYASHITERQTVTSNGE